MAILEHIPAEVATALKEIDSEIGSGHPSATSPVGGSDPPAAAADTVEPIVFQADLDSFGRFGHEWVVLHDGSVYVLSPNGGGKADLRRSIPYSVVKDARADMFVG